MPKLRIEYATYKAAKYACLNFHYSKAVPTARLYKLAAYEDDKFIGCVIFGHGANANIANRYGLDELETCELVRVALTKHHCFVSEIISKCIKKLKEDNPKIRLIISYSDIGQGHLGIIYQATNWLYMGETVVNGKIFYFKGKKRHNRSIAKLREIAGLKSMTCMEYALREDPNTVVAVSSNKHKYLYPLDKKMRKILLPYAKSYPKRNKNLDKECDIKAGANVGEAEGVSSGSEHKD